jgi:transcriptional regulator with PAS, ATPase and Fis domain
MILKHNKIFGKNIKYVSKEILDNLNHYHWPGNIRELENVIIYGLSMADENQETLNYEDIEKKMKELMYVNTDESIELKPLTDMIQNYEKELIQNALIKTDFNVSHASKILSVPRQTLQRKAKGYNLI